ncbi:MAG: glyoxalase [Marmoricola sp.]
MATISTLTLEVEDVHASEVFTKALGVEDVVTLVEGNSTTSGFRGYTISLVCSQPANVDAFLEAALAAGGTALKPAAKSFWGYGGVVQAPDGAIWKVAASSKKNTAPAARVYDDLVLLLGVADVKATKQFYLDAGLVVAKSYGSKYVEMESAGSPVKLALYGRKALAKDAGVPVEGSGSHRITIGADLGTFTDPDGFGWA